MPNTASRWRQRASKIHLSTTLRAGSPGTDPRFANRQWPGLLSSSQLEQIVLTTSVASGGPLLCVHCYCRLHASPVFPSLSSLVPVSSSLSFPSVYQTSSFPAQPLPWLVPWSECSSPRRQEAALSCVGSSNFPSQRGLARPQFLSHHIALFYFIYSIDYCWTPHIFTSFYICYLSPSTMRFAE